MTADTIHDQSQSIRDIVFNPAMEHLFLNGVDERFQIAACLDTIEDTQLAIDEYRLLDISEDEINKGKIYLAIYGVLQGLFLQQDALRYLSEALQHPFQIDDNTRLKDIRDLRNMIAGHPTSHRRKGREAFYAINRMTLSLQRFDILEHVKQSSSKMMPIDIEAMILDSETHISQALRNLQNKLEGDIGKHKARFHDKRLASLFHESLGYMCGKLLAGTSGSSNDSDRILAVAAVRTIEDLLRELQKALSERGTSPEDCPGVDLVWDNLKYPLKSIRAFFFSDDAIQTPDPKAARIFAWYVQLQLRELREVCQEIDEYYKNDDVA